LTNQKLRRDPHDPNGLGQWRALTILSMVLAMSIGVYGLILRMRGDARTVAWPFFFASVALLFLWRPRLDDEPKSRANPFSNQKAVKSRISWNIGNLGTGTHFDGFRGDRDFAPEFECL
jgi:hypothetical protein